MDVDIALKTLNTSPQPILPYTTRPHHCLPPHPLVLPHLTLCSTVPGPSVQFSSVAQLCLTLCDPMDCSTPAFPVHHQLPGPSLLLKHTKDILTSGPLHLLPEHSHSLLPSLHSGLQLKVMLSEQPSWTPKSKQLPHSTPKSSPFLLYPDTYLSLTLWILFFCLWDLSSPTRD